MKFISIIFLISLQGISQDTTLIEKQKGFLFLTSYNYQYDWKGGESKPLGFHDFFYPVSDFHSKIMLDSNLKIEFKNGVRVDFINGRDLLKNKARVIPCSDTSKCYEFYRFFVLPVLIDYKISEDYEPYVCRRNFYELQVDNGAVLRFEYLHKAIVPIKITPLSENCK